MAGAPGGSGHILGQEPCGSFKDYLQKQLADPEFRRACEARMLVAELAMEVRRVREEEGLTQAHLAELIGVKQPMIARLERGPAQRTPRWDVLRRVGLALGKQLVLEFVSSRPSAQCRSSRSTAHGQQARREPSAGGADGAPRDQCLVEVVPAAGENLVEGDEADDLAVLLPEVLRSLDG